MVCNNSFFFKKICLIYHVMLASGIKQSDSVIYMHLIYIYFIFISIIVSPWTVAHQASPSMGFYRQEYWNGLPFPSPGDLPHPGIEPRSPALKVDTLPSEPPGKSHCLLQNIEYSSLHYTVGLCCLSIL